MTTAEKNLTNPLYSYLWNVLKIDLANYKNLLDQTKANAKYRAIYIDLKNYQLPLPQEVDDGNGNNKLIFFIYNWIG